MNKNDLHAVVDIESLGDRSGSAVVSIGAIAINPFDDEDIGEDGHGSTVVKACFSVNICPQSCADAGLTFTGKTLDWWMERKGTGWPTEAREDLPIALAKFSAWYNSQNIKHWWSHATFDPLLLEAAYGAIKSGVPWDRHALKDLRTLDYLLEVQGLDIQKYLPVNPHVALDDAMAEALYVADAIKALT